MSANLNLSNRFFEELWNGRRLELADELFSSDAVTHQLRSGEAIGAMPRGPGEMKAHIQQWLAAFPDLHFRIDQMFEADDRVFTQCSMDATHEGTWMGIPPTGKRIAIRMMLVQRIEGGKIHEDWVLVESLGFFQQLGIISATPVLLAGGAS